MTETNDFSEILRRLESMREVMDDTCISLSADDARQLADLLKRLEDNRTQVCLDKLDGIPTHIIRDATRIDFYHDSPPFVAFSTGDNSGIFPNGAKLPKEVATRLMGRLGLPVGTVESPPLRGLLVSQEPKYTTDGDRIINRESGEAIPEIGRAAKPSPTTSPS